MARHMSVGEAKRCLASIQTGVNPSARKTTLIATTVIRQDAQLEKVRIIRDGLNHLAAGKAPGMGAEELARLIADNLDDAVGAHR